MQRSPVAVSGSRHVEKLYRYPVKGFTPEPLEHANLEPGRGFAWDRALAIADGSWLYDEANYTPVFKDKFIALMTHPKVAAFQLKADEKAMNLRITAPDGLSFAVDVAQPASADGFLDYLCEYLSLPSGQRPQLLRRTHGSFTDLSILDSTGAYTGTVRNAISLINLETVRDLAQKMGDPALDIRRFRANIYFNTPTAWEEADWVGKYVRLGSAIGKVVMGTPRCIVTAVNPESGDRDRGILQALLKHYRHKDLGIYLDIVVPGEVRPGDSIEVVDHVHDTHERISVPFAGMQLPIYVRRHPIKEA